MAIDPVCGMAVDPARASRTGVHEGVTYFFCAPSCKKLFEADPARYLDPSYRPSMGTPTGAGDAGRAQGRPASAPTPAGRRLSTVRVPARGDEFRVVQLAGMLLVCSRANGSCCCGWAEKGRMPFDNALWSDEWERRRVGSRLHLTFVGCLGPCATGNNALLQIHGRSIWLGDLNDPALVPAVWDWAEAMLAAERPLPPPDALRPHVFARFLPPPDGADAPFDGGAADEEGLEGLDPVCLMDADPDTAAYVVEHEGRRIGFCSAGCRERFLAEPAAYLAS